MECSVGEARDEKAAATGAGTFLAVRTVRHGRKGEGGRTLRSTASNVQACSQHCMNARSLWLTPRNLPYLPQQQYQLSST